MFAKRNREESIILRLEMLEDRRLLSGGLVQSLLASPLPSLLLRLTPSEVAAILREGTTSVAAIVHTNGSNSGGVMASAEANANVGTIAGTNLGGSLRAFQSGGPLLAFGASASGTSGMGTLLNFGAQGSVNSGQGINARGGGQIEGGTLFDFEFGTGGNGGIGVRGEMINSSAAGASDQPGFGSLDFLDLIMGSQSRVGAESIRAEPKSGRGLDSATETGASIEDPATAGSDGKSLPPQGDDLQDAASSAGPLGLLFQHLLDQVEDLGQELTGWLGRVSWVTWSIGIALAAVAYASLQHKWRQGRGRERLATTNQSIESWWFPGWR